MARLFEYKCKSWGYTVAANSKGNDFLMSREVIHCPVPEKCPDCGGKMKNTDVVLFLDYPS